MYTVIECLMYRLSNIISIINDKSFSCFYTIQSTNQISIQCCQVGNAMSGQIYQQTNSYCNHLYCPPYPPLLGSAFQLQFSMDSIVNLNLDYPSSSFGNLQEQNTQTRPVHYILVHISFTILYVLRQKEICLK